MPLAQTFLSYNAIGQSIPELLCHWFKLSRAKMLFFKTFPSYCIMRLAQTRSWSPLKGISKTWNYLQYRGLPARCVIFKIYYFYLFQIFLCTGIISKSCFTIRVTRNTCLISRKFFFILVFHFSELELSFATFSNFFRGKYLNILRRRSTTWYYLPAPCEKCLLVVSTV